MQITTRILDSGRRFVLAVLLIIPTFTQAGYEDSRTKAVTWLGTRQNTDGSWGVSPAQRFLYTVEAVQALRASGQRNSAYFEGVSWLENHAADNADYLARRARTLAAHGDDVTAAVSVLENQQDSARSGRNGWGLSGSYRQSPLDTAIVLDSLAVLTSSVDVPAAVTYLKSAQLGGSVRGWPVALETAADPFTTAMVVRTLVPLRGQDASLTTPVANGLGALSTLVGSGSPAYLQALSAHAALLAGDTVRAQTWLNQLAASQNTNGSWQNAVYETALAVRALAAADGADSPSNQTTVWMPDKQLRASVNAALGRNAMDSLDRSELARLTSLTAVNRGIRDLTGLEWALNLQSADLRNNQITSTAPLDGLTQLASLLLDGNPVVVAGNDDSDGDIPTLPQWGLILMASLLLFLAAREQRATPRGPLRA